MKSLMKITAILGLVLTLAVSCSSSGSATGTAEPSPAAGSAPAQEKPRSASPVLDMASMLTGTWEGSTPGNSLNLVITGTAGLSPGTVFNLPIQVIGKYRDRNVREQGVIHLENQGRSVYFSYIPHFDPAAGTLPPQALRFTPQELESACNFDVTPRGDGFAGETLGSVTCARAIHGAVGKWTLEIEPGSIRIRNSETGETLRFRKKSD
jgi:hypothetical protein